MKNNVENKQNSKQLNKLAVSDSDFILGEVRTIFKKKEEDMLWYIKEYFSKDEINRHSENLLRMISGIEGDIAEIKMKLIAKNY